MTKEEKLDLIKHAKYQSGSTILCFKKGGIELKFGQSSFDSACYWESQTKKAIRTIEETDRDVVIAGSLKIKELKSEDSFWEHISLWIKENEGLTKKLKGTKKWKKNPDGSLTALK